MQNYQYLLLAGVATWGVSAIGASLIFFFKELKQKTVSMLFALTAGVMLAISFFSLLMPAVEFVEELENSAWPKVSILVGIIAGAGFIVAMDKLFFREGYSALGHQTGKRSLLIVVAIVAHNIPEALAVGAAFGAYFVTRNPDMLGTAIALTIGISVHNLAEGAAVTFPLFADGYSRIKSFNLGHLSAIVYVPGIFIGAALVTFLEPVLPFILSFAVGTMLYVVFEELLPHSSSEKTSSYISIQILIGFVAMSAIELILG